MNDNSNDTIYMLLNALTAFSILLTRDSIPFFPSRGLNITS
jgi:hypothetical protein